MSTSSSLPIRLASLALIVLVTFGIDLSASRAEPPPTQQDPLATFRQIDFAGIIWNVYEGGDKNLDDAVTAVWKDPQGRLHMTIHYDGSQWRGSEVSSVISAHYGPQRFQVIATNPTLDNLDPNMVLGLFLYRSCGTGCYGELDHEITRWSLPQSPLNAQFAVQPANAGRRYQYAMNLAGATTTTYSIDWHNNRVIFSSFLGTNHNDPNSLLNTWTYSGNNVPEENSSVKIYMDFWLNDHHAPANGKGAEVIIADADIPTLCRPVADLACGGTTHGDTSGPGSRDQVDTYPSFPWSAYGREISYAFKPQAIDGKTSYPVTLQLANHKPDLDLFVLGKSDSTNACFSTNTPITYGNEVASFDATAGQTYFVVVDGASEIGGGFDLNTDCSGATPPPDPPKTIYYRYLPVVRR